MNREARRAALKNATGLVAEVRKDPVKAAAEIDELRRLRAGSYSLMHVLISRLVEQLPDTAEKVIRVARGEWQALPPREKLKVQVDPETNDVRLWIEVEGGS